MLSYHVLLSKYRRKKQQQRDSFSSASIFYTVIFINRNTSYDWDGTAECQSMHGQSTNNCKFDVHNLSAAKNK